MKKLYYGLLMLGTLAGMQSISYGAAAPAISGSIISGGLNNVGSGGEMVIKNTAKSASMGPWVAYHKGDTLCSKFTQSGTILCKRLILLRDGMIEQREVHSDMFYQLEKEYEEQENKKQENENKDNKQQEQKKAADEQVHGGSMVPTPAGGLRQYKDPNSEEMD